MNVVYYSSDFFAEMCGVSIQSLCEHNKKFEEINIYVVEDKISAKNKESLANICYKYNRNIIFIKMPTQEEVYPGITINLGRTYARMALGEILPLSVNKVLSLDSDTLIVDSLYDMYNDSFNENEEEVYVAGVYDCLGEAMQKKVLMAQDDMCYCNAGMFLIDLDKWRAKNVGMQLLNAVMERFCCHKVTYFLEQDIMNIVFYNHIKLLHPRYNMLTSIFLFDYKDVIRMKKPVQYYSEHDVLSAKKNPAIMHATTCFYVKKRMWVVDSDHPYAKAYLQYRSKTPWGGVPLIKDSRKAKQRIYTGFWHIIPKNVAILLATFLINYIRPLYAWITMKATIDTIAEQSST